jgi:hypothetical protein
MNAIAGADGLGDGALAAASSAASDAPAGCGSASSIRLAPVRSANVRGSPDRRAASGSILTEAQAYTMQNARRLVIVRGERHRHETREPKPRMDSSSAVSGSRADSADETAVERETITSLPHAACGSALATVRVCVTDATTPPSRGSAARLAAVARRRARVCRRDPNEGDFPCRP